jgi:asparagine synthase (glutamine-hydrolysing)
MRTNGFALFTGPSACEKGERSLARVNRSCDALVLDAGPPLGRSAGGSEVASCLVAYSLEEDGGLPLVHGFVDGTDGFGGGGTNGEYAFLAIDDGRVIAGRDPLGTRPLYIDRERTCVASDHRFFQEPPVLLPRGTTVEVGTGKAKTEAMKPAASELEFGEAARALSRLLDDSVARRVQGHRKVAVSFSGGLDSSVIALLASKHTEVVLCSASTRSSIDSRNAARAAGLLGLGCREKRLGADDVRRELVGIDLPFEPTPMDRALWCLYSTTSRMAQEEGAKLILLGQLADELFGGYMKYAIRARESESDASRMMEGDVAGSADRAFIRDELACSKFVEARFPFADQAVARFALGLPLSHKIIGEERKAVLRASAIEMGLPEDLARAPKKAAQYSSGLSKLLR